MSGSKAGKLLAKLNLAARGTSARIDELIGLVEQGILRAVSVGFRPQESQPIDKERPGGGRRYLKQELLECSLVAVPANPAAIAIAKQLNVSREILSLAFGEQAEVRPEKHCHRQACRHISKLPLKEPETMTTLSQRIEHTQTELNDRRDRLAEINGAEMFDVDEAEKMNGEIDNFERAISVMKAAEARQGSQRRSIPRSQTYTPPASNLKIVRRRTSIARRSGNPTSTGSICWRAPAPSRWWRTRWASRPEALIEKTYPGRRSHQDGIRYGDAGGIRRRR